SNHAAIAGGIAAAVKSAREKIGHMHRIAVEVSSENEIKEAINSGASVLVLRELDETKAKDRIAYARDLSTAITIEVSGDVTLENVRAFAEAGADIIRVDALTRSVRAMSISFQIQPG
ncbi:MAG TPA: hypothetical protein VEL78_02705, partial [Pyrinomonadaceae bacterium]|nr:hypothetical protein [Pyrinomonadaceae bacterium]